MSRRTGLAISGVFGAGKTRSAAALLAGLLVFDPSLHLMVLTKENVVHMQLLSIWCPCSSLITFKVKWDVWLVTMSNIAKALTLLWTFFLRTETQVIRQKSLIIGCGGKNVGNPLAPLLTGWVLWTSFWRGLRIERYHCFQRSHHLCRHDCSYSYSCPN